MDIMSWWNKIWIWFLRPHSPLSVWDFLSKYKYYCYYFTTRTRLWVKCTWSRPYRITRMIGSERRVCVWKGMFVSSLNPKGCNFRSWQVATLCLAQIQKPQDETTEPIWCLGYFSTICCSVYRNSYYSSYTSQNMGHFFISKHPASRPLCASSSSTRNFQLRATIPQYS